jgi:hypothetical protein
MRAAIAIVVGCAVAGSLAHADKGDAAAAVANLDALFQPIHKLTGAEREKRACADAQKLFDAGKMFSHDTAPAGSSVDNLTWSASARSLGTQLDDLVELCKTPDHKRKLVTKVQTADEVITGIDEELRFVVDAAKPREMPANLRPFLAAVKKAPSCSQHKELAKKIAALTAPAKADAAKWATAVNALKASLQTQFAATCNKPRAADEEIASAQVDVHDRVYALVLLLPPR